MGGGAARGGHRRGEVEVILARREIGDHVMARLTAKFEAIGAAAVGQRVVTAVALEPVVADPPPTQSSPWPPNKLSWSPPPDSTSTPLLP